MGNRKCLFPAAHDSYVIHSETIMTNNANFHENKGTSSVELQGFLTFSFVTFMLIFNVWGPSYLSLTSQYHGC